MDALCRKFGIFKGLFVKSTSFIDFTNACLSNFNLTFALQFNFENYCKVPVWLAICLFSLVFLKFLKISNCFFQVEGKVLFVTLKLKIFFWFLVLLVSNFHICFLQKFFY